MSGMVGTCVFIIGMAGRTLFTIAREGIEPHTNIMHTSSLEGDEEREMATKLF